LGIGRYARYFASVAIVRREKTVVYGQRGVDVTTVSCWSECYNYYVGRDSKLIGTSRKIGIVAGLQQSLWPGRATDPRRTLCIRPALSLNLLFSCSSVVKNVIFNNPLFLLSMLWPARF